MSRGGVYRGIYCSLIEDPDYQRLTANARLILLTLRLCPTAGAACIFRVYPAVVAEQAGLEVDQVELALQELGREPAVDRPWILREGSLVWIRNGLRYDPNVRLASDPKHRKSIERAVAGLPKVGIVARFCAYYGLPSPFGDSTESPGRPFDDPSSPRPSPRPNTETESEDEDDFRVPTVSPNGHRAHAPTEIDL